ncbi:biotin synthase BioB [Dialister sp.]|uniref:biotin synthase BioB n=1 Tax=Dialister sp. TaxID=1955814 RepID=UPI002E819475|nr:biotin synthase BioB [Dialister sp.]MEE3453552.1 biotin synthase BioB [Dialister sp.]
MDTNIQFITACLDKVLSGGEISRKEAGKLYEAGEKEPLFLMASADKIRKTFCGDKMRFCSDVNARSGRCTENCRFCAQSGWYKTGVDEYPLRTPEFLLEQAKKAEEYGAERFGIVTSGRGQSDPVQFDAIVKAVEMITKETKLSVCCSLGLLTDEQLARLKKAGCQRIHCNLETAQRYFPHICTTHTYEEKEDHIRRIQKAGLEVCSGGIMGLGETTDDRIDMAFALKSHHITSVPLNIFSPIPGTPFGKNKPPKPLEVLTMFSVYRFILPHTIMRVCAGRETALRDLQAFALAAGLNGAMIGGYLTIAGRPPEKDKQMAVDLGRQL